MEFRIINYDPKYLSSLKTILDDIDLYWPMSLQQGIPLNIAEVSTKLREKDSTFLWLAVCKSNDEVAGFLDYTPHPSEKGVGYIALLNVRPQYFRQGVGRALLEKAIHETAAIGCPRVDLHTWSGNCRALPLYKELGFVWIKDGNSTRLENYLPLLLNFPPLKPYFKKYYWQSAIISSPPFQEDFTPGDNNELITYKFKSGDIMWEATIDRLSKGVASFSTPEIQSSSDLRIPAGDPEKIIAGLTLKQFQTDQAVVVPESHKTSTKYGELPQYKNKKLDSLHSSGIKDSSNDYITSTTVIESCSAETDTSNTSPGSEATDDLFQMTHNFSPIFHQNDHKINERQRAIITLPEKLTRKNYQPGTLVLKQITDIKAINGGNSFQLSNSRKVTSPYSMDFESEPIPNLCTTDEDTVYLKFGNNTNKTLEVYCQINTNRHVKPNIKHSKAISRNKLSRRERLHKAGNSGNEEVSECEQWRWQDIKCKDNPLVFSVILSGNEQRSIPLKVTGIFPGLGTITVKGNCEGSMASPRPMEKRQHSLHIPVFTDAAIPQLSSEPVPNKLTDFGGKVSDYEPLSTGRTYGYYLSAQARIESKHYILEVDKKSGSFALYDKPLIKDKECKLGGKLVEGNPIIPGPPFEPHEFNHQQPNLVVSHNSIQISFSSEKYPGLSVATILLLSPEGSLTVTGKLNNASGSVQTLETRFRSEVPLKPDMKLYAPLKSGPLIEDILPGSFPVYRYDFPKAAENFSEPNFTISFPERDVNCEFPEAAEIDLGNNLFPVINLHHKLHPGEVTELPPVKFNFFRKKIQEPLSDDRRAQSGAIQLQPDVQTVGLTAKSTEFNLVTRRNKPFKGSYHILDNNYTIKQGTLNLTPRKERSSEKISLELPDNRITQYSLEVRGDNKQKFNLPVIRTGDHRRKVSINMGDWIDRDALAHDLDPIQISNNSLSAIIRPEFSGSLTSLSEQEYSGRDNLLDSSYPEVKNFSWFYPFQGGITPFIHNMEEPFPGKHLLNYQVPGIFSAKEKVFGQKFRGISLEYKLKRNINLLVQYLTLPGSNLLYTRLQVKNKGTTISRLQFGQLISLSLREDEGEFNTTNSKTLVFPRKYPKEFITRDFATITASDYAAAMLAPGHMITLLDGGTMYGNVIMVSSNQMLQPGSSVSLQLLTAFTGEQSEAEAYQPLLARMFI